MMNTLPLEILDAIVSALKDTDQPIAPYATVSSLFYRAVERVNFESISVESNDLEPAKIPIVPAVLKFQLHSWSTKDQPAEKNCGHRMVESKSAAILAQKMPNIQGISWKISDNDKRHTVIDIRQNRRFGT
jgi:hypothetical protein